MSVHAPRPLRAAAVAAVAAALAVLAAASGPALAGEVLHGKSGDYTIELPAGWAVPGAELDREIARQANEFIKEKDLKELTKATAGYDLMVLSASNEESINVVVKKGAPPRFTDAWVRELKTLIETKIGPKIAPDYKLLGAERRELRGVGVGRLSASFTLDGQPLRQLQLLVPIAGGHITVTGTAPAAKFGAFEPVFERAIATLTGAVEPAGSGFDLNAILQKAALGALVGGAAAGILALFKKKAAPPAPSP